MNEFMMHPSKSILAILVPVVASTVVVIGRDPSVVADATACALIEHPLEFANRHVRVGGTVTVGYEFFGLMDEACPSDNTSSGRIWLDDRDDLRAYSRGWSWQRFFAAIQAGQLQGDGPRVDWETPTPVTPIDQTQLKRLYRALNKRHLHQVHAKVIGRSDYAGDGLLMKSPDGHFTLQTGFGHLNGCSGRIVLESVEVVDDRR
jgi:hypothetical protein